jgi:hypothetical protein
MPTTLPTASIDTRRNRIPASSAELRGAGAVRVGQVGDGELACSA